MLIGNISDLHYGKDQAQSYIWQEAPYAGHNSRLVWTDIACRKALDIMVERGVDFGVCHGDSAHPKGKIDIVVEGFLSRFVSTASEKIHNWVKNIGNHGAGELAGEHIAKSVWARPGISVIAEPTEIRLDKVQQGLRLCVLPYQGNEERIADALTEFRSHHKKGDRTILMLHDGIQGGVVGTDEGYRLEEGFDAGGGLFDFAEFVLAGHYHRHQVFEAGGAPCCYIGSPLQRDFGDWGAERGLVLLDTRKMQIEFVPIPEVPRFYQFKLSSTDDLKDLPDLSGHYAWFRLMSESVDVARVQEVPTLAPAQITYDFEAIATETRLAISQGSTLEQMIPAYVEYASGEDIEAEIRERRKVAGLELVRRSEIRL